MKKKTEVQRLGDTLNREVELCHCGRPAGHRGPHLGTQGHHRSKVSPIEREQMALLDQQKLLCGVIVDAQAELVLIDKKLEALKPVMALYAEAPAALPRPLSVKEPDLRTVASGTGDQADAGGRGEPCGISAGPLPVVRTAVEQAPPGPKPAVAPKTSKDYAPQAVDLDQLRTWAANRGVECNSWADLAAVNAKREHLELPLFVQRIGHRTKEATNAKRS